MNPKPKKVLGIDPGYGRLGWAIIEQKNGKDVLVDAGCFETSPRTPYQERLQSVGSHVTDLFLTHKPDLLAMEKLFFYSNQKTAMNVAEIRGMILHIAGATPTKEFTPAQIKQAVCGYGKADKKQMQSMTALLLGLAKPPQPDDKADAIAAALTGMHHVL
ncbi:MAG: crossover junction endodeoxyribonuclease RuvC [Candidatus Niyogibacteria bacterium CG10_big_fil_rev_8_21_14_0_10_46_36]|uniref:Crossover junction endodeoxyribonuclease RuvC n=1 Tax=Candidatus Niyogibacteria bacterium CG10_big_fil_rev_8_21_14_0_10_46_36 TaxID=1974726 RepID=A0A2H0TDI4_9BACT|nr:MAG: crossover junction endodeoxyribonuclease RuvC [Candidatus Niyogibacteria bacterium CG10_big_fil_rev_8_21_14_0_10_46_36]